MADGPTLRFLTVGPSRRGPQAGTYVELGVLVTWLRENGWGEAADVIEDTDARGEVLSEQRSVLHT